MKFTKLATGSWLEGLALDGDTIWVSDVMAGGVRRFVSDKPAGTWRAEDRWIGGLLINHDGKLLSSGKGGLRWFDPETGAAGTLVDAVDSAPLGGINEMAVDDVGGIVFGTVDIPAFERGEQPGPASLCRLRTDGTVERLVAEVGFTNGLAFSPDRRRLYHNETFAGVVAADCQLGAATRLLDKADCDGMKVDVDGRIWVTGFRSDAITILDPDGCVHGTVALPAGGCTNLCFGGADGRDVVITTVTPLPVEGAGEVRDTPAGESALWRGRAPVAGLKQPRPRFTLD